LFFTILGMRQKWIKFRLCLIACLIVSRDPKPLRAIISSSNSEFAEFMMGIKFFQQIGP
jgi:hypothetical protein